MTDKTKNVRISDIARMAGVSVGTVDRILHNRGKVSKTAQEKVNRVLQEVEYRPNLMARSLALKKQKSLPRRTGRAFTFSRRTLWTTA